MINFQMVIHTYGKSTKETIRDYISIRYERWLDYSKYKCSIQKMDEFAVDLLDEVLLNLLQRDEQFLLKLYNKKKVQSGKNYTELDFFILRAIDLNSISDNAPFRWKNRPIPTNREVKLERMKVIDEQYFEVDRPGEILKQMRLVRWIFTGLDLTEFEKAVFEHRFINDESFTDWPGPETYRKLNSTYNQIIATIHHILYYLDLTKVIPKGELTGRKSELADQFIRAHRVKRIVNQLVKQNNSI